MASFFKSFHAQEPSDHKSLSSYKTELSNITQNIDSQACARQVLGDRLQMYSSTYLAFPDFIRRSREGLQLIAQTQSSIDKRALLEIQKMDFAGTPELDAIIKADILQNFVGIDRKQMLNIFEQACMRFENEDRELALSMFMALLLLNPFIATLWYCIARCFETKKDLKQSLYSYAISELLTKGNIYSALDAVEYLIAGERKDLAKLLLREIQWELEQKSWPKELYEKARKLEGALKYI